MLPMPSPVFPVVYVWHVTIINKYCIVFGENKNTINTNTNKYKKHIFMLPGYPVYLCRVFSDDFDEISEVIRFYTVLCPTLHFPEFWGAW